MDRLSLTINCFAIEKQPKVFARLFQKAAGLRGGALIAARRLRNFCSKRAQEGRKTVQWTVFRWGFSPVGSVGAFASLTQRSPPATRTPRRGFPIVLRLLCILPSDTYFFYTLRWSDLDRLSFYDTFGIHRFARENLSLYLILPRARRHRSNFEISKASQRPAR